MASFGSSRPPPPPDPLTYPRLRQPPLRLGVELRRRRANQGRFEAAAHRVEKPRAQRARPLALTRVEIRSARQGSACRLYNSGFGASMYFQPSEVSDLRLEQSKWMRGNSVSPYECVTAAPHRTSHERQERPARQARRHRADWRRRRLRTVGRMSMLRASVVTRAPAGNVAGHRRISGTPQRRLVEETRAPPLHGRRGPRRDRP